jgi:hypothetical protein
MLTSFFKCLYTHASMFCVQQKNTAHTHRTHAALRASAWLCALFIVGPIAYPVVHSIAVGHVRCASHGEWLHADHAHAHAHPHVAVQKNTPHTAASHVCQVFLTAVFHEPYNVAFTAVSALQGFLAWAAHHTVVLRSVHTSALYRIAPKNSPPVFSF